MFIRIKNTQADSVPLSHLSAAIQAAASSLPVKNINDFTSNYYAQIGKTGEERSEIVQVAGTPSNGTVTSGTTRYPHPTDTPVYSIKYNQLVIYRSTSGTSGSAAPFGTIDITPDHPYSQFEDAAAQSGYAYKTAYRNSVLDVYSSQSNWVTTSGYSPYSRAGIRDAIRRRIKNIPGIEDDDLNLFINEYMEILRSAALQVNEDYGIGTLNIAVGAGTQEYTVTDDLHRSPVRVWLIGNGGTVPYTPIFTSDIDPSRDYSWDPRFYLPGDNVIGLLPTPQYAGTLQVIQSQLDERLDSDDDLVPRPMKPYVIGFIKYGQAQCYRQDGKDTLADAEEQKAMAFVQRFKTEINPRQRVSNEQVLETMDTSFMNDFSDWGW